MPFIVKVKSDVHIYLSSETDSKITKGGDDGFYCKTHTTLTFFTNYISLQDECGYQPPKFLILDGFMNDLVKDELISMNKFQEYKPYYDIDYSDIDMNTVYVMKDKIDEIDKEDLKEFKRTKFTVPISKRKRKLPSSSDTTNDYSPLKITKR